MEQQGAMATTSAAATSLLEEIIYEDAYVKLTNQRLVLKWYTFPIATSKAIPLIAIKEVRVPALPGQVCVRITSFLIYYYIFRRHGHRLLYIRCKACGWENISIGAWQLIVNAGGLLMPYDILG